MKLLRALLLPLVLLTGGCQIVCDQIGEQAGIVDEVLTEGLSYVPLVGPFAGKIVSLGLDIVRTTVCAPYFLGEEVQDLTGITLDPTRVVEEPVVEDPGDGSGDT